jgi:hypothetical protein
MLSETKVVPSTKTEWTMLGIAYNFCSTSRFRQISQLPS